jgi:transposase-like protein
MPCECITVTEQRQRFLEGYQLNYYSRSDLAERFGIPRRTTYKWIIRMSHRRSYNRGDSRDS